MYATPGAAARQFRHLHRGAGTRSPRSGVGLRPVVSTLTAVLIAVAASLAAASPAWAHGQGETEEGYLLVQQALGHLAHDTGQGG